MRSLLITTAIQWVLKNTCDSEQSLYFAITFSFVIPETFAKMINEFSPLESFPISRSDVPVLFDRKLKYKIIFTVL